MNVVCFEILYLQSGKRALDLAQKGGNIDIVDLIEVRTSKALDIFTGVDFFDPSFFAQALFAHGSIFLFTLYFLKLLPNILISIYATHKSRNYSASHAIELFVSH